VYDSEASFSTLRPMYRVPSLLANERIAKGCGSVKEDEVSRGP
jgi:hypothetical protein